MAAAGSASRLLALIGLQVEHGADPATPRFAASEPRVVATPYGRLDERHPLRRAFRELQYPASTERVLAAVRSSQAADEEQARWLAGVLPADATFGSEDELVAALGVWGPGPPVTHPAL
jgi:hypothetical protein